MERWILWLLLEAATIMTVASLWFIWRGVVLRKKAIEQEPSCTIPTNQAPAEPASTQREALVEPPFKAFAQALEHQANQAADQLIELRQSKNYQQITRIKLWGTLVKAERAIVLNGESDHPKPILNRFMASIINTLELIRSKNLSQHSLTKALQDIDDEFIQTSELLISKEELIHNQRELHLDLHKSIESSEHKLRKLNVKINELERLKSELKRQQQQIDKLEQHEHNDDQYIATQAPEEHETQQHYSTRHLHQLERLSKRQQAIIEHLQAQLKDSDHRLDDQQEQAAQHMALSRIERLSKESKSLIGQLQTELDNTNLTINVLKQDISDKDKQLAAMDAQIKAADGNLLEEFKILTSNKRDTLEALLDDFAAIQSDDSNTAPPLSQQEKEVRNLKQMLKESETCVKLLAQELANAEAENTSLREQIKDDLARSTTSLQPDDIAELSALREENHELAEQVHDMKEQLINQVSDSSEKALRNEYNKKSLELDRLQLAYSDLERKYLGTLR